MTFSRLKGIENLIEVLNQLWLQVCFKLILIIHYG